MIEKCVTADSMSEKEKILKKNMSRILLRKYVIIRVYWASRDTQ